MTGDYVAIQRRPQPQRPFHIYAAAGGEDAQIGALERFGKGVKSQEIARLFFQSQASTVYGNALSELKVAPHIVDFDFQSKSAAAFYKTCFLNQSGKHDIVNPQLLLCLKL